MSNLISLTPVTLQTLRLTYASVPWLFNSEGVADASNPANYILGGSVEAKVFEVLPVSGENKSVDLVLDTSLPAGAWSLTVIGVLSIANTDLAGYISINVPTYVVFPADGARSTSAEEFLHQNFNPALIGKNWDALLGALAIGDHGNSEQIAAARRNMLVATAEGENLEDRLGDINLARSHESGLPDSVYQKYGVATSVSQLSSRALQAIIEAFYGLDSSFPYLQSSVGPWDITGGGDLQITIDGTAQVLVVAEADLVTPAAVYEIELAAVLTRILRGIGSRAIVLPRDGGIRIYSGTSGLAGSLEVTGGTLQALLQFAAEKTAVPPAYVTSVDGAGFAQLPVTLPTQDRLPLEAAHLQDPATLPITSWTRGVDGEVVVDMGAVHGLLSGNQIIIDGSAVDPSAAPVVTGDSTHTDGSTASVGSSLVAYRSADMVSAGGDDVLMVGRPLGIESNTLLTITPGVDSSNRHTYGTTLIATLASGEDSQKYSLTHVPVLDRVLRVGGYIDTRPTSIGTYTAGTSPYSVTFDITSNCIWVANYSSNNITKREAFGTFGTIVGTYTTGTGPQSLAFDITNNHIWVSNYNSNNVTRRDASGTFGTIIGTYGVGALPHGIAFDIINNCVWVVNRGSNNITRLDASGTFGTIIGTYTVGTTPYEIAFDVTNNCVWVANSGSSKVSRRDASGTFGTIIGTYSVGADPRGVAFDVTNNCVWVTNYFHNNVTRLDASGTFGTIIGTYRVGASPLSISSDVTNNCVWVTNSGSTKVTQLDASGTFGTIIGTYTVGTAPYGVTFDVTNNCVWVANNTSNNATKISLLTPEHNTSACSLYNKDTDTWADGPPIKTVTKLHTTTLIDDIAWKVGGVTSTLPATPPTGITEFLHVDRLSDGWDAATIATFIAGTLPINMVIDLTNEAVWVSNANQSRVTKLSSISGTILGSYIVGSTPWGVTVDSESDTLWVSLIGDNKVARLSGSYGTILGTYTVGTTPGGVVSDDNGSVWVANTESNNLSRISTRAGVIGGTYAVSGATIISAIASAPGAIWVTDTLSNDVRQLSAIDGSLIGTYAVAKLPRGLAYDDSTNSIWVTNYTAGKGYATKLHAGDGSLIGTYRIGASPAGIAYGLVSGVGYLWVVNSGDGTVSKIQASDGSRVGTYTVPFPYGITYDSITSSVWVVNWSEGSITKLAASDGSFVGSYALGLYPTNVLFDFYSSSVWITNYVDNTVTKLYINNGSLIGSYGVGYGPLSLAQNLTDHTIWVTNHDSTTVSVLDNITGSTLGTYTVGTGPAVACHDNSYKNMWILNEGGQDVTRLSDGAGVRVGTYTTGDGPQHVIYDSDNSAVWVNTQHTQSINKHNALTGSIIGTITAFSNAIMGLCYDTTNHVVWATNTAEVLKIDSSTCTTIGTYATPTTIYSMQGIAYNDTENSVWVNAYEGGVQNIAFKMDAIGSLMGTYLLSSTGSSGEISYDSTNKAVWATLSQDGAVARLTHLDCPVLNAPRTDHVQLEVGGKLMAVGGYDNNPIAIATCETLDPTALGWEWTYVASMSSPRASHGGVVLSDGRLLVVGGLDDAGADAKTCEIYDSTTNLWVTAGTLAYSHVSPVVWEDTTHNRVYVMGGSTTYIEQVDLGTPGWHWYDSPVTLPTTYTSAKGIEMDGGLLIGGGILSGSPMAAPCFFMPGDDTRTSRPIDGFWSVDTVPTSTTLTIVTPTRNAARSLSASPGILTIVGASAYDTYPGPYIGDGTPWTIGTPETYGSFYLTNTPSAFQEVWDALQSASAGGLPLTLEPVYPSVAGLARGAEEDIWRLP